MSYVISLQLKSATHQRFQDIHQQLNQGQNDNLAKALGEVLADISYEVIDQVFGEITRVSQSGDQESARVIQHIMQTTRKYMPWSVSLFGNERLLPMVNYLHGLMLEQDGEYFLSYPVDTQSVEALLSNAEQMQQGINEAVMPALHAFTEIVDQGVTHLIRIPKQMLKFNVMVDKTLNGVIHVTTQMGYKRFDKLGTQYDAKTMSHYFNHFLVFLRNSTNNEGARRN
jgi:hypothetical protein